jgi:hypothetical protein
MKRSAVSLVLCTLVTTSASAFAQSAPAPAQSAPAPATSRNAPLSESLTGAAKADYDASKLLRDKGDFAGAYARLGQAYVESNDPRILFNMAICARDMHDYARMRTLLVRYKREGSASMTPGEKSRVDAALADIPKRVGALGLTVSEANATVNVDGEAVGTTPLDDRVYLNPGQHKLTVSKPGFQPVEQLVAVTAGSDMPFTVHLQAEIPSTHSSTLDGNGEQATETRPVVHEGATGPGHATTSNAKTIGLVVGGAGVAGIALGTVFGLLASSKWSQAKNDCGHGCPNGSPARSEENEASTDGTVSTIAFAIGGVALATGLVLYLTAPATPPAETASRWTLLASGGAGRGDLTLQGVW